MTFASLLQLSRNPNLTARAHLLLPPRPPLDCTSTAPRLQMANSDEELKKNEGGTPDAIDNALAFGDGPAKEMFGVELSKP